MSLKQQNRSQKRQLKKEPEFCWFCVTTVKDCEHQHNREQKKMNKFLNWVNYGGNSKTGIQVVDNHYTEYGRGYQDAIGDVYRQLIKTFKVEGLHRNE